MLTVIGIMLGAIAAILVIVTAMDIPSGTQHRVDETVTIQADQSKTVSELMEGLK